MNKQELIERVEGLKNIFGNKTKYVEKDTVIELISELDEPQKVVVPQFVADWIEEVKPAYTLFAAMEYGNLKIDKWLDNNSNQETFARAWLDGYEVEKEKRYWVKLKAVDQYLVSAKDEKFLGFLQSKLRSKFTRKELEDLGFGWVFDCEGIEIEEVTE